MSNDNGVRIGTLTFEQPKTFRNSYETARWYQDVEVPAGSYEVRANLDYPTGSSGNQVYWLFARLPGTVTGACFTPLFGGVPIGPDTYGRDQLGKPGVARTGTFYGYAAAALLRRGEGNRVFGGRLELDPEWTVTDTGIVRATPVA